MNVFWVQGYESTSLQDLLRAMDLSKSSFYQVFGSKHQLFERCVARYRETLGGEMTRRLAHAESGLAFIEQMLVGVADEAGGRSDRRGCLVMNTASEFAQRDPSVAAQVKRGAERFVRVFRDAVQRAQAEGDIDPERDPDTLARYLVTNMGGLRTMVKAGADPATIRRIGEVVLRGLQ